MALEILEVSLTAPSALPSPLSLTDTTFRLPAFGWYQPTYRFKVSLPNGSVNWEQSEAEYLPVAARLAWFRKDHPYWSIITKVERLADKAVIMKAVIKDFAGTVIATARKRETEIGFPDYIEKAETGALAMCGYGTLQAPEFDEQDRLADAPVEKLKSKD